MPVSGDVATLPLAEVVRLTAGSGRAFRIRVRGPWAAGLLHVETGAVVHGHYGPLTGEAAVFAIMAEPELTFAVEPASRLPTSPMRIPWQVLAAQEDRRNYEHTERRTLESLHPSDGDPVRRFIRRAWPAAAGAALVVVPALLLWLRWASARPVEEVEASGALLEDAIFEESDLVRPTDVRPTLLGGKAPTLPSLDAPLRPTIPLRLRLDREGRVAERRLLEVRPGFETFEEAAVASAASFVFSPARRAGRPVGVWIHWPLTFDGPPAETEAQRNRPLRVESSTWLASRLGRAVSSAYRNAHGAVALWWDGQGTAVGLAGLLDGTVDAVFSARPLLESELAEIRRRKLRLAELIVAHDALAVVVHPSNDVRSLGMAAAARLLRGQISDWVTVGGPRRPVRPVISSATTDEAWLTTQRLLRDDLTVAASATVAADPQSALDLVAADQDAVAVLPASLVDARVRVVPLSFEARGLAFSPDAVLSGRYPALFPIYLYTRAEARAQLAGLIELALSSEGQKLVASAGFAPAVSAGGRIAVALPPPDCAERPPVAVPANAALATAVVAAVPPVQTDSGLGHRILFGSSDDEIQRPSRTTLEKIARRVRHKTSALTLVGPRGEGEGGRAGARRRTERVAAFLRRRGVDRDRLRFEFLPDRLGRVVDVVVPSRQTPLGAQDSAP